MKTIKWSKLIIAFTVLLFIYYNPLFSQPPGPRGDYGTSSSSSDCNNCETLETDNGITSENEGEISTEVKNKKTRKILVNLLNDHLVPKYFDKSNLNIPTDKLVSLQTYTEAENTILKLKNHYPSIKNAAIKSSINISPNPFSSQLVITINVHRDKYVNIQLYDAFGRSIDRVANNFFEKGIHTLHYDSFNLPKGYYFIHYQDETTTIITQKVVKF